MFATLRPPVSSPKIKDGKTFSRWGWRLLAAGERSASPLLLNLGLLHLCFRTHLPCFGELAGWGRAGGRPGLALEGPRKPPARGGGAKRGSGGALRKSAREAAGGAESLLRGRRRLRRGLLDLRMDNRGRAGSVCGCSGGGDHGGAAKRRRVAGEKEARFILFI